MASLNHSPVNCDLNKLKLREEKNKFFSPLKLNQHQADFSIPIKIPLPRNLNSMKLRPA